MGCKRLPGLYQRNGIWHIDKQIQGQRICESTGTGDLEEAEKYLARRRETIRQASVYGVRPHRSFREAATKYLLDEEAGGELRSLDRNAQALKIVDPYIGDLPLRQVHMGTLEQFIRDRRALGIKNGTIARDLAVVRRVLNLAARLWRDEYGMSWLEAAPLIQLPKASNARKPYPMSRQEQRLLFAHLPPHLQLMALFKVNTGCRQGEVCQLRWDMEVQVPELNTSVFIIPADMVKNKEDRLVVLNRVARSVIERLRNSASEYVFTFKEKPVARIYNSAWKRAREKAANCYEQCSGKPCPEGFRRIRVHDLKHTFGRRLRAAGVSFEDRQDLLGHTSGRITTHYSGAELGNLIKAAEQVCGQMSRKSPALVMLRQA